MPTKQEKKERINIWLPPSLLKQMDSQLEQTDSRNRSEYVRQAVEHYSGFVASQSAEGYLSQTLMAELDRRLKKNEMHISKTIFRLAVELSTTMHIVANLANIEEDFVDQLHKHCIQEVKAANGHIRFDETYAFQHSDE